MSIGAAVRDMRTMNALIGAAEAEAHRLGDRETGAEHVLLAALELPEGSARRAIARAGADPADLRGAIVRAHAAALAAVGIDPGAAAGTADDGPAAAPARRRRPVQLTANGRIVFRQATELARREPRGRLAGAHVVLAAAALEHGTAARALAALPVDRDALAAAARAELGLPAVS